MNAEASLTLPCNNDGVDFPLRGPLMMTIKPVSLYMHEFFLFYDSRARMTNGAINGFFLCPAL
jgi:hypothetical protein